MALVLVATAGAANANTFATAAEMTAYCEGRLNASVWTGAEAQWPALVEATRTLSGLLWLGNPTTEAQALAWPRAWVPVPDPGYDASTLYLDDATVPQAVKDATCELALQYLKAGDTDALMPDAREGVKREQVDVIETEYFPAVTPTRGIARYPVALQLIARLLANAGGGMTVERV